MTNLLFLKLCSKDRAPDASGHFAFTDVSAGLLFIIGEMYVYGWDYF